MTGKIKRIAIWNSEGLMGQEIKNSLADRRELWDELKLLAPESETALVSEIAGEAALVLPATADNLSNVDLLFYCAQDGVPVAVPQGLPEAATTVIVGSEEAVEDLAVIVAGINSDGLTDGGERPLTVASAHPATVALTHLLQPLVNLGLESCVASVVLPSSTRGQEGIDALLAETRAILAFQPPSEESVFGQQLAFNIAPSPYPGARVAAAVAEILGYGRFQTTVQMSLGGIFHSLLAGVHVQLAPSTDEDTVRGALESSPTIEFAQDPEILSPVDAAASTSLLLGGIEPSTTPGGFWLRAVMDNLTVGGALNAIGIAEAVLARGDTYTM